jgi:hypothetical protein
MHFVGRILIPAGFRAGPLPRMSEQRNVERPDDRQRMTFSYRRHVSHGLAPAECRANGADAGTTGG